MKGSWIIWFLRDRLFYLLLGILLVGIGVGFMLLEQERYPGVMESGTILYYVVLACFIIGLWLVIDAIRQRAYFLQLQLAIEQSSELQATHIVRSVITREQRLVAQLLQEQYSDYLNELEQYRKQQDLHNHFVLQWVHQMKTPISVIDLLAQEALQQLPSTEAEQQQLIVSVQEEVERMTRGLEMMLYTARLEKFEMDLHLKRIAIHEVIRTVMNTYKRLCIRHSIFPQIIGEAWVETDEKWMTVVLHQFISNAIKYSKPKPGTKILAFSLESLVDGSSMLSVRDEGVGIAPHDMPRIFDPFFTGENGRAAGESTGMGLYLAKQVCSRLGHRLTVTSDLGVGTTFTITFEQRSIHKVDHEK
ncbi:MAG: sensor histidine kinase [Gorillibacterium sp.]|nr:sensor histidine kinase [Gorillibacterium sp.]